jgi:hypothetical protein
VVAFVDYLILSDSKPIVADFNLRAAVSIKS